MPTTFAGLSDDSIGLPYIDKLFPDAGKQALACHRVVMLPGPASIPTLRSEIGGPPLSAAFPGIRR